MVNEIVKYANRLNSIPLRRFNIREMNLFFSIASRVKDQGTNEVEITFSKLKELSQYKQHGEHFIADLNKTYRKLLSLNAVTDDGTTITGFVLFTEYEINRDTQTVKIAVNPKFKGLFNELSHWTRFSLEQFSRLHSTYSKTLFRLLKQYRTVGKRVFKIEDFKTLLDIPSSYKSGDIDRYVLKPAKEELSPIFKGLAIRKTKRGRGGKIYGLVFTFQAEIKNADDFKHYNDDWQSLNAIDNNVNLTKTEKYRAKDRVLGLPLGTTEKSAKKRQAAEQAERDKHAAERDTIKAILNGDLDMTEFDDGPNPE